MRVNVLQRLQNKLYVAGIGGFVGYRSGGTAADVGEICLRVKICGLIGSLREVPFRLP